MAAMRWASGVRRTLLAWWDGVNACQATGAHDLDRKAMGIWSATALHYSCWPDSVLSR